MTLAEKKQELVEELSIIEDQQERFQYIIDLARTLEPLPKEYQIDTFLIKGCLSQLWLVPSYADGRCHFKVDSDAIITKGVARLLTDLYSGSKPDEIVENEPTFLAELGIDQHLSPNRRNGLSNVWKTIKAYAELCLKNEKEGAVKP